jgi:hypothetical protein
MNSIEKKSAIDRFEAGGAAFDDLLSLDEKSLNGRPFSEAWTIHEHVVHVLEADIATFHRYRRAIAEPGSAVLGFNEEVWTPALNYQTHDLGATISLIRALRSYTAAHLRTLVEKDWTLWAFKHDSAGLVNLEAWIEMYIDHIRFHRELIDRNLRLLKS